MQSIPCPSCRQRLNLPDSLRGSPVRCPHCRIVFTASGEEPALVTLQPAAEPSPVTQGPIEDFNFKEDKGNRPAGSLRTRRKTSGPANLLRTSACLEFVISLCCFAAVALGNFE